MLAMNEAVIGQGGPAKRLMRLDLAMDGQKIATYLADGMIMATPTGSTAYSLAAGGPIVYPSLHSFILTPINPHILANRPLVIPDNRVITAEIFESVAGITADGQTSFNLKPRDKVILQKADWLPTLIHPRNRNYFHILRSKLSWGERTQ
jgi:NAD+ kinase